MHQNGSHVIHLNNVRLSFKLCSNYSQFNVTDDVSFFRVAAGKKKLAYSSSENYDEQKFEVEHIHYPSQYNDSIGYYFADIVLIVLKTPIEFKSYISPICLPFGEAWFEEKTHHPTEKGKE